MYEKKKVKNHLKKRLVIVQNGEEEDDVDGRGSEEHVNGYKYAEKDEESAKKETLIPNIFFYLVAEFFMF